MVFHLPRVLTRDQVAAINAAMDSVAYVDGMQTGGANVRNIKKNRQVSSDDPIRAQMDTTIQAALKANGDFQVIAVPYRVASVTLSSYVPGLFYGDHADNAVMGRQTGEPMRSDLSMTIFLNDPADYDGGELLLDTDLKPTSWKLPAGDAVIYPSFSLHRVDPVRRGERRVAVTWIQSHIRSPQQRQILIDLSQVLSWMIKSNPGGRAHEHPEFRRLDKIRSNLTRLWAEF
ncbi:MAG: Fe2+-dependent dioxygenase [Alphaproteobacteria bacterium]|nr:Fe2+-dependent dioxygenase [Alphaproteobacteria bacterium]